MAISGTQQAQMSARSGVMRSGTSRSGAAFVKWVRSTAYSIVTVWVVDKR